MRLQILSIVLILLCLPPFTLIAAEKPITIEVTGEAVGSDMEAPRELFVRAKAEAQRTAVEQAVGTFIRSHTIVSNSELAEDLIHASVRSGAEERIKIIATKKEEPLLHGGFKEGFKVYDGKSTGLLSDLLKRLAQLETADWGETTLLYRISPAK